MVTVVEYASEKEGHITRWSAAVGKPAPAACIQFSDTLPRPSRYKLPMQRFQGMQQSWAVGMQTV